MTFQFTDGTDRQKKNLHGLILWNDGGGSKGNHVFDTFSPDIA